MENLIFIIAFYLMISAFIQIILILCFNKLINTNKIKTKELWFISLLWIIIVPIYMIISIMKPNDI